MIINEKLYNDLLLDSHRELAIQSLKTLNKFENALIITNKHTNTYHIYEIEVSLDEFRREIKKNESSFLEFTKGYNYYNFKIIETEYTYSCLTHFTLKIIKNDRIYDCQIIKYLSDFSLVESVIKPFDAGRWCF